MDQGICYFLGSEVLGGRMTFSRGIRPSKAKLYLLPQTTFDRKVGDLVFDYPGNTVTLTDCAVLTNTLRPYRRTRDGWRWSVQVADRRWKWQYASISGTYNAHGTSPRPDYIKNLRELATLCLDAIGEAGYDVSNLPDNVYPPVEWRASRADLELQWLCDLVAMVPVLVVSTNTVKIEPLNDPSGGALPATEEITPDPSEFTWKSASIPENLRVQGAPTIYQSELTLSPVGMETDGAIEPIADLSYKPTDWTAQWPYYFSDVSEANRHLALKTVYRWFRPTSGWTADVTISSFEQIELLNATIERVTDADGVDRPLPPRVRGTFWPYSDLADSTASDTVYTGAFRILPEIGVVEFEQPVFQVSSNVIADPVLKLTCAYLVRDTDGVYDSYTRDLAVSQANSTTAHKVLFRPECTKEKIEAAIQTSTGDNETAIEAIADVYLANVEAAYDFAQSQDVILNGIKAIDLDGAISQIQWSAGRSLPATTRVSLNDEFDIYSWDYKRRRDNERLMQAALKLGI